MPKGRNALIQKLKIALKRNAQIKEKGRALLEGWRGLYIRLARGIYGIKKNRIVFSSLLSRNYGDNLKPISEMLHEMKPDAEIIWMFRDINAKKAIVPDYVKLCDPITLEGLRAYATARVWVDNFTLRPYYKRRIGKQFYLNTWHGDRAFKKYAYDAFPDGPRRIEETCDIMLAASEFGKRVIRSAFRYNGELMVEGCPRNDCLVDPDPAKAAAIREKLGIDGETKLLIYCPTFRDSTINNAFKGGIDLERALDDLEKKTGDKWKCLFRAHHLAYGGLALKEGGRLIDMSKYEDMADLLLISDALITDYSSAAMDFSLTGRRVFIYQDDIDSYTRNDRSLHFRMEDSPFLVAHDQQELSAIIAATGDEEARENCRAIADFFGTIETGKATLRCCEKIIGWMS